MRGNTAELPLFDHVPPPARVVPEPEPDPGGTDVEKSAREFVKWCLSFGTEFRNSPDEVNVRFWAKRKKLKFKAAEESEILTNARRAFDRRVELQVRENQQP